MIPGNVINQIKTQAVYADWYVAFGGKAKGNQHLSRVVTIAKFLADKEGADGEICEAGAWLHDIGLIDGNDDDPLKTRAYAESLLADLPLDEESRTKIADCAETHEGTGKAACIEAQVVHDADVLEKMGLLGVIRHTWKIVNLIDPEASSTEVLSTLQKHLAERQKKLYTATAKQLAIVLSDSLHLFFANQPEAVEFLTAIMSLAKTGLIAEEIVDRLSLKEKDPILMQQLNITNEILQAWYDQREGARELEQHILASR